MTRRLQDCRTWPVELQAQSGSGYKSREDDDYGTDQN